MTRKCLFGRIFSWALLLLISSNAKAQLFIPDSSFNNFGYLTTGNPNGNTIGQQTAGSRVLPLADGTTIVAGVRKDSIVLWKYLPGGGIDNSFGIGGHMAIYIPPTEYTLMDVSDISLLRGGKIMLLANATYQPSGVVSTKGSILLLRFNGDGTRDPGFNGTGYVLNRPLAGFEYMPVSLAVDSTGAEDSYYVGGYGAPTGGWAAPSIWFISKYKANGSLDVSFNGTGCRQGAGSDINTNVVSSLAVVHDLQVNATGKLLALGAHRGGDHACFLMRLNADGSFDPSYGNNGRVYRQVTGFDFPSNQLTTGRIHPDGSSTMVTMEGYGFIAGRDSSYIYAVRNDANGSPVTSFGTGGVLRKHFEGNFYNVTFDSANRMMLAWYQYLPNTQLLGFTRFSNAGVPDTSFGGGTGTVLSEPIPNDLLVNRAGIRHVAYTPDFGWFYVLTRRTPMLYNLFRYRFVNKAVPQHVTAVQKQQAIVYPNPATDKLYIKMTGAGLIQDYKLISITGQLVRQASGINAAAVSIDVKDLPTGQYLLQATLYGGEAIKQWVIIE